MPSTWNRQPQYTYTYAPPAKETDGFTLFLSVLALPFVILAATFGQAVKSVRAYGTGVAAGLGIGPEAQALSARQPPAEWDGRREAAFVQYLFGPAWRDVKHTVVVASRKQLDTLKAEFKRVQARHFLEPEDNQPDRRNRVLGSGQIIAIGLGLALAETVLLAALVAQAVAIGALWVLGIVLIYLLRAVDSVLLYVRHIAITCPNPLCHERVPYPSYRCPGCSTIQHDVRPGRYGVIHRTCRCGNRMRTLLMLGSHRMKAVCPRCKKDLEDSAGSSRELALPVFGSSSSGKTQLLAATALALQGTVDRAGGAVEPADDYSRTWFRHVADLHSRGGSVTKTTAASQHATSLRLVSGKSRLLVKMFDAAGENFLSPDKIRELQYLRGGGTLVFVLDPLSLPVLWNGLDDDRRSRLGPIRASGSPRDVFQATVQTLHQISIDTRRIRLAVVVSKADVIGPEIERWHVGDDGSIRDWLAGAMQQDNLIRNVEHEFASARFFLTDATLGGRKLHPSIETLASWLLTGEGMRL